MTPLQQQCAEQRGVILTVSVRFCFVQGTGKELFCLTATHGTDAWFEHEGAVA
jgi:hypothetical protein